MRDRWIPTADRLPEEGERVLAFGKMGYVQTCRYETRWVVSKRRSITAFFTDTNKKELKATHWMPLPEKPEEATP